VGRQPVRVIADLECGGAEELAVRFGDEEPGHLKRFLLSLLEKEGGQALGLGFLFGGKNDVGHGNLVAGKWEEFRNALQRPPLG
jgi:hypothetical protein